MSSVLSKTVEINRELVAVLESLLKEGEWEASLFLQAASKRIHSLHDQAKALLKQSIGNAAINSSESSAASNVKRSKVFISLYQADSRDLTKWQMLLNNLAEVSMSRPIYRQQEEIEKMIRYKEDSSKEAYVAINVEDSKLIQAETQHVQKDRSGFELVVLKEGAIQRSNIVEFVHGQQRYKFVDGMLKQIANSVN